LKKKFVNFVKQVAFSKEGTVLYVRKKNGLNSKELNMFCCNCGNQLLPNINFCSECGNKVLVNVVNYNKLQKINKLMCFEGKPFSGSGIAYYGNAQKKNEETFKDGMGHGRWTYWYENGQKAQEICYLNNQFDGLEQEWYENAQQKTQIAWSKGQLHGVYISWYENGQKEGEINYCESKKHGCETLWYENGQMYSKGSWEKGVQVGYWIAWKENGQKKWQGYCEAGEIILE